MKHHLFNKIFDSKLGKDRIIISVISFIFGLLLILTTVDVYQKINVVTSPENTGSSFLVVNKKLNLSNLITNAQFSDEEISRFRKQPFVEKLGVSTPIKVDAWLELGPPINNKTDLFFEAIPSEFIDVETTQFHWEPGDKLVPVIVPKQFIDLYNFGYALSKGLPQVSKDVFTSLKARMRVGRGPNREWYDVKVVELSDRIPTVIVPKSFVDYANEKFRKSEGETEKSRVVVKVTNPSDPALQSYLKKHRYETNREKLKTGKAGLILQIINLIVLSIGISIVVLSFFLIESHFALFISEAKHEIKLLLELGYTPNMIGVYFLKKMRKLILIEVGVSFALFIGLAYMIGRFLSKFSSANLQQLNYVSFGIGALIGLAAFYLFRIRILNIIRKYT